MDANEEGIKWRMGYLFDVDSSLCVVAGLDPRIPTPSKIISSG